MFQRVQLLRLLLFFGPKFLAKPLKAYLKSVRSDKVSQSTAAGKAWLLNNTNTKERPTDPFAQPTTTSPHTPTPKTKQQHQTPGSPPPKTTTTTLKSQALFFAKFPDLYVLNKALTYVRANEATVSQLVIVHCYGSSGCGGNGGGRNDDDFELEREKRCFREFERYIALGAFFVALCVFCCVCLRACSWCGWWETGGMLIGCGWG